MEKLPEEVLLIIFDQLTGREILGSVKHVCQRWATILEHHTVSLECIEDVKKVNRRTRTVRIATRLIPYREFILFTPYVAPNIRELTIYAVSPLGPEDYELLNLLPHLEHLDIFLRNRVLNHQLIPMLVNLKSFVINEIVPGRVLRALAASERLHSLYMYGRALYYPRRELLTLLRSRRYHLQELTLRCTELHDTAYAAIGQCENLTSLQLYSCWLMTCTGALHVTRPKKLRRLHITGARMLRTRSLTSFLDQLPLNIEEFNLSMSWFADEHVGTLVHRLPKLRSLELWKCRITQDGVMTLAENLPELHSLDLDIMLENEQVLTLDHHPTLSFLRCLTEYSMKNNPYIRLFEEPKGNVEHVVPQKIKLVTTDERYPFKYFRSSGEGYRASLFYYWTQDVVLEPVPKGTTPIYDADDDFY